MKMKTSNKNEVTNSHKYQLTLEYETFSRVTLNLVESGSNKEAK